MTSITLTDFQFITATHGQEQGQAYFAPRESLVHSIFPDRIIIFTDCLDYRSFELRFQQEELQVIKTRLDDYRLHLRAKVIEDAMDEEDWAELHRLWHPMVNDLVSAHQLKGMDIRIELRELFTCLFEETEAEYFFQKWPKKTKPSSGWIWDQMAKTLEKARLLAEFEWKEWANGGVDAVNALAPLQQESIHLPYPSPEEMQTVNEAPDWERALLQYFNARLDASDLKLLAIGTHFDELQTFACLRMRDLNLLKALEKFEKLGIVYKY